MRRIDAVKEYKKGGIKKCLAVKNETKGDGAVGRVGREERICEKEMLFEGRLSRQVVE